MTSDYQIWLTADAEKEKIMLPVNPTEFKIKCGSRHDSVNVSGLGEITIMQGREALQISFSSFFPSAYFPGCKVKNPSSPLFLIAQIKKWIDSDKPIHLIVTNCGIDMYCTIEDFPHSESGGDVGTYAYSLTLKEYREVSVRQIEISIPPSNSIGPATASVQKSAEPRVDNTIKPKTYTVKEGDEIVGIAKKVYGNSSEYNKILYANKQIIGGNQNRLYAGLVLNIPS